MSLLVVLVMLLGLNKGLAALFLVRPLPRAVTGPVKIKPTVQILPQQDGFALVVPRLQSGNQGELSILRKRKADQRKWRV